MNKKFSMIPAVFTCTLLFCSCKKDPASADTPVDDGSSALSYMVGTFAGNGTNGNDPATGGLALLYFPANVVSDAARNIYVADGYNDKIKKIAPSGTMTTLAGSTIGYADGVGTAAKFDRPMALAIDAQGNLYVGESGGLRIRKVTPDGSVSTIAGNGTPGLADGIGTAAQIDIPGGLAVDKNGNIYFTQKDFHGIRKISSTGAVSTFVGSTTPGFAEGTGTTARFNEPYGLVCDAAGYIYVSDHKNARIRRVSPAGVVTTFLQRNNPDQMHNITMDSSGNFYIVEGNLDSTRVVLYDTQGSTSKIAGGPVGYQDGTGNIAQFSYCSGLIVDSDGIIYFSDLLNHKIRKIQKR